MSIASAVAGFVSLGITVCNGLIQYYNQWSDFPDDVRGLVDDLERFGRFQEHFKAMMDDGTFHDTLTQEAAAEASRLEDAVKNLQKKLQKIKANNQPKTIRDKTAWHARRMIYPFRESTIMKLRETVQGAMESIMAVVNLSTRFVHVQVTYCRIPSWPES